MQGISVPHAAVAAGTPPVAGCGLECIYVVGGSDGNYRDCRTVERYDPKKDMWEVVEAMSSKGSKVMCAVLDNRLHAIAQTVDVYDPATRTWDRIAHGRGHLPLHAFRRFHVCVTLGDQIYALGGDILGGGWTGRDVREGTVVQRYDERTGRWEDCANMYRSLRTRAYAVLGDHIYAIGGVSEGCDYPKTNYLKTVQRYNPTRDCWEPVQDMPVGRWVHAAAVMGGCVYALGGRDNE